MNDRERLDVLDRVRTALCSAVLPDAAPVADTGSPPVPAPEPAMRLADRFEGALVALSGHVHRVTGHAGVADVIAGILDRQGAHRLLAWTATHLPQPGLTAALEARGIECLGADLPRNASRRAALARLEPIEAGLTGAAAGLADTGSIVLIHGPGRPRLASLLPRLHVAVLEAGRLYASLPEFVAAHPDVTDLASNVVIVTGPSRTADIEMTLTHGVHGPRDLHVVLVGAS